VRQSLDFGSVIQGRGIMTGSSNRDAVNQSSASNQAQPRTAARQVPLHAVRIPAVGNRAARESVRQSPPNVKSTK
jgi:hypothetical protein